MFLGCTHSELCGLVPSLSSSLPLLACTHFVPNVLELSVLMSSHHSLLHPFHPVSPQIYGGPPVTLDTEPIVFSAPHHVVQCFFGQRT